MTQTTDAALATETWAGIRMVPSAATPELRAAARRTDLYKHGDMLLRWVNEGDLMTADIASRQAADTIEAQARQIEALEGAGKRALAVLADLETNHPDCMGWAAPYPSTTPCIKLEADALRAALEPTP